jgi:hypothetical protein
MTDKEVLFLYRLKQAEETLIDAENMLRGGCTVTDKLKYYQIRQ